eukprot:COSAG01_NODE_828_length_13273_cov_231.615484_11_plen_205_part_00
MDRDNSGAVDPQELRLALRKMGLTTLSEEQLQALVQELDIDGDKQIDLFEFVTSLKRISRARFAAAKLAGTTSVAGGVRSGVGSWHDAPAKLTGGRGRSPAARHLGVPTMQTPIWGVAIGNATARGAKSFALPVGDSLTARARPRAACLQRCLSPQAVEARAERLQSYQCMLLGRSRPVFADVAGDRENATAGGGYAPGQGSHG